MAINIVCETLNLKAYHVTHVSIKVVAVEAWSYCFGRLNIIATDLERNFGWLQSGLKHLKLEINVKFI
jgi:hypothetical protein